MINTKLRSYNYNFFMRNILYGTRLKKMKIKEDSNCLDCGCKGETLMHLYWTCPSTKRIWERLKDLIWTNAHITLHLVPENCLLRTYTVKEDSADSKRLLNILCLLTKHYIHLTKCKCEIKNFENLTRYIINTYKAAKQHTQHLISKKWGVFTDWLKKHQ